MNLPYSPLCRRPPLAVVLHLSIAPICGMFHPPVNASTFSSYSLQKESAGRMSQVRPAPTLNEALAHSFQWQFFFYCAVVRLLDNG